MNKNLIPKIAKLLGVKFNEEFKIKVNNDYDKCAENLTFMFNENGLGISSKGFQITDLSLKVLLMLLRGDYKIVKLPWKPKVGERYFTYFGAGFTVVDCSWQGFATQYSLLKNGCVFRTEEEAFEKRPEIYKELTCREWSNET